MPWIQTEGLTPEVTARFSQSLNNQVYNSLDCCLTYEIWEEIRKANEPTVIYDFERALQAPYLEIMQRGFLVDDLSRRQAVSELRERIGRLTLTLNELAQACWSKGVNPRSPAQLKDLFYTSMRFPEIWMSQKGQRKLAMNRETLEKLDESYMYARPLVQCILRIRELSKQVEVLETEIDPDGRMRTSYNIAGTETGRPSSSQNAFGTGTNLQNITPSLRYAFTADRGYKMCVIDLEQVEARDVGFFIGCLFDDWLFLDACESGDLHSMNARLIWPELPWTGDRKADRAIADQIFYRDFSYRDMAKRGSHLSNYSGTAWTAARSLKVPLPIMQDFQDRYCRGENAAYPGIPRWWQWTAQQLQTTALIETPFGRRRHFFGRPGDDTTLREAIAFLPQSTTADRMNLGMFRVWKQMPEIQLLGQTYDSITFQYREDLDENEIIEKALKLIEVELVSPSGRKYCVPGEAKHGFNWGACVTQADIDKALTAGKKPPRLNPGGLVKWSRAKPDLRRNATGFQRVVGESFGK